ncbi:MAG: ImmA/IrrE family metallo-endopeptidase [Candidatus Abyssobacteria bacterium SURF_5]|uniref:ImmA/IrrE family metallo-endopeptidase n=1 Tax=Abyssobacteria bacterium (strain SURF_5) TaxID=2093360 RepID=A0A3A4P0N4_ABYX5|nr:MAG: ImmA/IrrE family metallo-endopeptidase [Candidatus Abyssubacteria bacterium SURF_5]
MAFDLALFADKLRRYCKQFEVTNDEISQRTGISLERLNGLAAQESEPTGDEVLILADFFKCDYKFFISNEKLAPFEQTELLFRKYGDKLTRDDRWAIQEFLFLCECQYFLLSSMSDYRPHPFKFEKTGHIYKEHGVAAAAALRRHLGYEPHKVPMDIYDDFRKIGIHVFRRRLIKSSISGLFIRHPVVGPCVLVNYTEDVFRQRFSAAHEAAHAILDDESDFVISFSAWDKEDLSEIRANAFASHLLMPPEFLKKIPVRVWDLSQVLDWAVKLMVNIDPLLYALCALGLMSTSEMNQIKKRRVRLDKKSDPELPENLSPRARTRKEELLKRGLSDFYVKLCFDAFENGIISGGRLAEMLLITEPEIMEIAALYGRGMGHVN